MPKPKGKLKKNLRTKENRLWWSKVGKIAASAPTLKIKAKSGPEIKLWIAFPDTHFPEQDEEALEVALRVHETLNPNYTIHLGDLMDCAMFSDYAKRTIPETVANDFKSLEVDPTNAFWDRVQENTLEHCYYILGNHEARLERWAARNGQIALGLFNLIDPVNTVGKHRKDFTVIPYTDGNNLGGAVHITKDLVAVHGFSIAKHAAAAHLGKSRTKSILYGHTHRDQRDTSRDPWSDRIIKAFSPGCLSKLQPLYAHGSPSDWTHGINLVYVCGDSWTEYVININNGSCVLPDGREIKI